jgi:hypothetical protein
MAQVSTMKPGATKMLRWVEKNMTRPLIGVCAYEALALGVPALRWPPISILAHRHKNWAVPLLCGAFVAHVWFYEEGVRIDRSQVS